MFLLITKKIKKQKKNEKYSYAGIISKTKNLLKCKKNDLISEICNVNA